MRAFSRGASTETGTSQTTEAPQATETSQSSGQKSGRPLSKVEFYDGAVDCAQYIENGGSMRDYLNSVSTIMDCLMARWPDVECKGGLTSLAAGQFSGIDTIYCKGDPKWIDLDLFFAFAERMGIQVSVNVLLGNVVY